MARYVGRVQAVVVVLVGEGEGGGSGVCNAAVSVTFLLTSHPGVCRGL